MYCYSTTSKHIPHSYYMFHMHITSILPMQDTEQSYTSDSSEHSEGYFESDWECESDESSEPPSNPLSSAFPKPILQLFFFLLVWQATFKISNAAISILLKFLKYFLAALSNAFQSFQISSLSGYIPITRYSLRKALLLDKVEFTKFIVCPNCDSIFSPDQRQQGGKFISKTCSNKPYPQHPMISRRKECGTQLMRTIRTKSGFVVIPRKIYPYQSINTAIQNLLQRPGFLDVCEKWRARKNVHEFGYMTDIYDGQVWRDYKDFLSEPCNYLLTLNVDWFCPFDATLLEPCTSLSRTFPDIYEITLIT